jgi:hypothetical protein
VAVLTTANLRYAVMRAVELAELAELMKGDAPNEGDEDGKAGGSAEEREVAHELSLKSHEAHELVLGAFRARLVARSSSRTSAA